MKTLKQNLKLTNPQYRILLDWSHYSNNLYNYSLYICKKYFEETGKYIGFKQLYHEVKHNENYKLLPTQCAVQIIKLVDQNYRSFFALLKRKNNGEYKDKVQPPKFKRKGNLFLLTFHSLHGFSYKNNQIKLYSNRKYDKEFNPTKIKVTFPFHYNEVQFIKQIIVKPVNNGQYFKAFIQYQKKEQQKHALNPYRYLSIDLGLDNLASCFSYPSGPSLILNGKPLKSYNRWYNKRKAFLQNQLKKCQNRYWSKQLQTLNDNRENFIDNYFNQTVNYIIKYCVNWNIGSVVIGYNKTWKKNINISKVNNQKFVSIPHLKFKQKLENKCIENGVFLEQVGESYTSKSNFLNGDKMEHGFEFTGTRKHRGSYVTNEGLKINADINGAANILRKVIPDAHHSQGIVGSMLNPIKVKLL